MVTGMEWADSSERYKRPVRGVTGVTAASAVTGT